MSRKLEYNKKEDTFESRKSNAIPLNRIASEITLL